jgi:hypothetical protein
MIEIIERKMFTLITILRNTQNQNNPLPDSKITSFQPPLNVPSPWQLIGFLDSR